MDFNDLLAVILLIIFPIGFIGNAIVLSVLIRHRVNWPPSTYSLFDLALSDTIFLSTIPFWAYTYSENFKWHFGLGMCKLLGGVTSINMYATIFFLTVMSVERWQAVVYALRSKVTLTRSKAQWMSLGVWCLAILLSVPRFVHQTLFYDPDPAITSTNTSTNSTKNHSWFSSSSPNNVLTVTPEYLISDRHQSLICTFRVSDDYPNHNFIIDFIEILNLTIGCMIPLVTITVCYFRIILSVRKEKSLCRSYAQNDKITKLCAVIIAAFFVCWLPVKVLHIYAALARLSGSSLEYNETYHKVYSLAVALAWANSCINPIIYAFVSERFQESFKTLFCKYTQTINQKRSETH